MASHAIYTTSPTWALILCGILFVLLIVSIAAVRRYRKRNAGSKLGLGAFAEPQPPSTPAKPADDSTGPPPAGWYDDPEAEGVRRYWNGAAWTDSRVTTEGIAYRPPSDVRPSRAGPSLTGLFLATVLLIGGAICLWVAENYKPSLGNQLGLNSNSFVLSPTGYHTLMIVGIVCLVLGAIRLLTALLR
jgi:hypothetical protein